MLNLVEKERVGPVTLTIAEPLASLAPGNYMRVNAPEELVDERRCDKRVVFADVLSQVCKSRLQVDALFVLTAPQKQA